MVRFWPATVFGALRHIAATEELVAFASVSRTWRFRFSTAKAVLESRTSAQIHPVWRAILANNIKPYRLGWFSLILVSCIFIWTGFGQDWANVLAQTSALLVSHRRIKKPLRVKSYIADPKSGYA
jgi:hypothetical protein